MKILNTKEQRLDWLLEKQNIAFALKNSELPKELRLSLLIREATLQEQLEGQGAGRDQLVASW